MVDETLDGSRIAFLGNVANASFRAVTALRARGVDAHLFVSATDSPTSRPETAEPSLAGNLPSWIHDGPWITPRSLLLPSKSPVIRRLADFDAVVATGPGPIYAQFSGRPWAFYVTGGDLTVKPFPITFWRHYPNWPHRGAEVIAGAWQRRAIRRADQIWSQPFAPMVDALDRLEVADAIRSDRYVPMALDADRYQPDAAPSPAAAAYVDRELPPGDVVVFHPSRLAMVASEDQVRTGQWKGNGTLIDGFARFQRATGRRDVVLALIDFPVSRDVDVARRQIAELGITDQVRWLAPPDGRAFDHDHMVALYRRSDLVADEFGVGWFGYVALEGAAMAKPVLSKIDETAMGRMYPSHPFVSSKDAEAVAADLAGLVADPDRRAEIGRAGRQWVVRHHGHQGVGDALVEAVASLVS